MDRLGAKSKWALKRFVARVLFDNKRFWNKRYAADLTLGSGPGSREENLKLKNDLIREILARQKIHSVLDIGCGDIEILKDVKIPTYTGIDISEVVIERNRALKPEWEFMCADICKLDRLPKADLVLCLDVLIHQRRSKAFFNILEKFLLSINKIGVVSGYNRKVGGWNVFFHVPLNDAIKSKEPSTHVEVMATYRDTDLIRVTLPCASSSRPRRP